MPFLTAKNVDPVFGTNYKPGYSYGTFRDNSFMSYGIAWLTRWENLAHILCSHVGIVSESGCGVEALLDRGVVESDLSKYFNDPHVHIFFRKPRAWMPDEGIAISAEARKLIGCPYDKRLLKAHAISGSFIGHFLRLISGNRFERWIESKFNTEGSYICSKMNAHVMQRFPRYAGLGCLIKDDFTINPVEYITDPQLWTPLR